VIEAAAVRTAQLRVFMDTAVHMEAWSRDPEAARAAISRAFNWFHLVETSCSRFDSTSELSRLSSTVDVPVPVSELLFQLLQVALVIAEISGGAFDPTVGDAMVRAGFRYAYRNGASSSPRGATDSAPAGRVSYRDIVLDPEQRTVTLRAPMTLDLGAIAKGLAVDLASRELHAFPNHIVNAGGDIVARGAPPGEAAWPMEIRDPLAPDRAYRVLHVRDLAVCTSGGYLRRRPDGAEGHHIIDRASGGSPRLLASATVLATSAAVADALATAVYVLGPARALPMLAHFEVEALLIDPGGAAIETPGLRAAIG